MTVDRHPDLERGLNGIFTNISIPCGVGKLRAEDVHFDRPFFHSRQMLVVKARVGSRPLNLRRYDTPLDVRMARYYFNYRDMAIREFCSRCGDAWRLMAETRRYMARWAERWGFDMDDFNITDIKWNRDGLILMKFEPKYEYAFG